MHSHAERGNEIHSLGQELLVTYLANLFLFCSCKNIVLMRPVNPPSGHHCRSGPRALPSAESVTSPR
jgi:hypothetical protein